jgi:hypothetical protein
MNNYFRRFNFLLMAIIMTTSQSLCFAANEIPGLSPKDEPDAGVIIFAVEKLPQWLVFVSVKGKIAEVGARECIEDAICKARVEVLIKAKKSEFLNVFLPNSKNDTGT